MTTPWPTYLKDNYWIDYITTSECTRRDIKECLRKLSETGETFTKLRRSEGGFSCLTGPNFQSSERENRMDFDVNPVIMAKGIRLQNGSRTTRINWPFNDSDDDSEVVMSEGHTISWRFETTNCPQWSEARRVELSDVICKALRLSPITKKTRSKKRPRNY